MYTVGFYISGCLVVCGCACEVCVWLWCELTHDTCEDLDLCSYSDCSVCMYICCLHISGVVWSCVGWLRYIWSFLSVKRTYTHIENFFLLPQFCHAACEVPAHRWGKRKRNYSDGVNWPHFTTFSTVPVKPVPFPHHSVRDMSGISFEPRIASFN